MNRSGKFWEVYLNMNTPGRYYKLYFWKAIPDFEKDRIQILKMPEVIEVSGGSEWPLDCGVSVGDGELRLLMDQMWRNGIRPTEGHGSTGQIAAVENHLKAVSSTHDRLLTLIEKKWGE